MEVKQNIRQYFTHLFVIPAYQRGYKWGVSHKDGRNDAEILVEQIYLSYKQGNEEYFVQGITIYEKDNKIYLVDGQQRTTTYFLLLSILCREPNLRRTLLMNGDEPRLDYAIRKESKDFLSALAKDGYEGMDMASQPDIQDIFYFNEALHKMSDVIKEVCGENLEELEKFTHYVLDNVFMFVVTINEKEASGIFSMMNGGKAFMKTDELVKADILCKASRSNMVIPSNESPENIEQTLHLLRKQLRFETAQEWDVNAVRSRLARQWDKWLYWWNREDVKRFFSCGSSPMGLLLKMYCKINGWETEYTNRKEDVATTFKQFQNAFLRNSQEAKNQFEQIRKLQKRFESIYNDCHSYNYLGLVLSIITKQERMDTVYYFILHFNELQDLKRYALLRIANVTHLEIVDNNTEVIGNKVNTMKKRLSHDDIYNVAENKEFAFRVLFMLNVLAADKAGRRFSFYYLQKNQKWESYYSNRSLEHIWPKSKVYFVEDGKNMSYENENSDALKVIHSLDDKICRTAFEQGVSEHCIGNLAFLHKDDNSKFNAKMPEEKKKVYFDLNEHIVSRNLLHTISRFAFDNWSKDNTPEAIKKGKENTLRSIDEAYEIL